MKVKKQILRSQVTGEIYKIREYDEFGNLIHCKDNLTNKGYEEWRTYDKNNNLISFKDNTGYEMINEYDDNGVKINEDVYEYEYYPENVEVSWKTRIEKVVSEKILLATGGVGFLSGVILAVVAGILF